MLFIKLLRANIHIFSEIQTTLLIKFEIKKESMFKDTLSFLFIIS